MMGDTTPRFKRLQLSSSTLRIAVFNNNVIKWVDLKPSSNNSVIMALAQLFTPRGDEACPNAPFELCIEDGRTYIGSGEHASRIIIMVCSSPSLLSEYPQFRTMHPPPNAPQDDLGEYLVKDMTLARFRDELFVGASTNDAQTACWITDLEFFDTEQTSLSFLIHYVSLATPHYYDELIDVVELPRDARMTVRMFFLAIPPSSASSASSS
jgi:hypothetical protein